MNMRSMHTDYDPVDAATEAGGASPVSVPGTDVEAR